MTRSIGDWHFKTPEKLLICTPDIEQIKYDKLMKKGPLYVIVACDGLWDYMTHDEVIAFIAQNSTKKLVPMVSDLVFHIIDQKKGTDNISIIIIKLTN
jgi:serine/threonine protein phosphatase PrpC